MKVLPTAWPVTRNCGVDADALKFWLTYFGYPLDPQPLIPKPTFAHIAIGDDDEQHAQA